MKSILCRLAQRKDAPTKMLGKHVSNCRECSKFFKRVTALENKLIIKPEEPDLDLCAGIFATIASEKVSAPAPPKPRFTPALSLLTFSAAALIVFGLTLAIAPHFSQQTVQVADLSEEQRAIPAATPRKVTLEDTIRQSELVRRDAAKLGSHLRENLILFSK